MSDNLPNDFQGSIAPTPWVSSGEPESSIVSGIAAAVLACQQAAASATAAAAQAAAILAAIEAGNFPGGGGTDPTPPATTSLQGKVKLAGDLGGTADLPTVPVLAGGSNLQYFRGDRVWATLSTVAATPASVATVASDLDTLEATVAALPPNIGTTLASHTASIATLTTDLDAVEAAVAAIDVTTMQAQLLDLIERVGVIEEIGANAVIIAGISSQRVNQINGSPLHTESVVIWDVDAGSPTNKSNNDFVWNRQVI